MDFVTQQRLCVSRIVVLFVSALTCLCLDPEADVLERKRWFWYKTSLSLPILVLLSASLGVMCTLMMSRATAGLRFFKTKKNSGATRLFSAGCSKNQELKLVLVVRQDLGMGKGKIAAQCAHAALGSYKRALETRNPYLKQWMDQGQPKIVVKTDSEQSFLDLRKTAAAKDIMTYAVHDAGRTQVASGSLTVLAVGPASSSSAGNATMARDNTAVDGGAKGFGNNRDAVIRLFDHAYRGTWPSLVAAAEAMAAPSCANTSVSSVTEQQKGKTDSSSDCALSEDVSQVILACRDGRQWTVLHFAAAGGNVPVVTHLLTLYPGLASVQDSEEGATPLMVAARHSQNTVCEMLLTLNSSYANTEANDGRVALHFAIQGKSLECVQILLRHGAKLDVRAKALGTPLYWAVTIALQDAFSASSRVSTVSSELLCIIECLLQHHPNLTDAHPERFPPLLVLAASSGSQDLVQLLLNANAPLSSRDADGWTALHSAAEAGHLNVVQRLVESCKMKAPELLHDQNKGKNALDLAVEAQHADVVALLKSFKLSADAEVPVITPSQHPVTFTVPEQNSSLDANKTRERTLTDQELEEQEHFTTSSVWTSEQQQFIETQKLNGNRKVEQRDYLGALNIFQKAYTSCYPCKSSRQIRSVLQSNTSYVLLQLGRAPEALDAALNAIKLRPSWFKGYLRASQAYKAINNYEEAACMMWETVLRIPEDDQPKKLSYKEAFLNLIREAKSKESSAST